MDVSILSSLFRADFGLGCRLLKIVARIEFLGFILVTNINYVTC